MSKAESGMTLLVLGVIGFMIWEIVAEPLYNRDIYRAQVLGLFESVEPGMARQQVRNAMDVGKYPDLRFRQEDAEGWSASAPHEFGATNWILRIDFQDERVSAVRIRTADGDFDHPAKAPPDKIGTPTRSR
jgi:hypothetical protein